MTAPVMFYFDFSSPYGYLAAQRIDALCARHGRSVDWRPMLLGAVFKLTGAQPLLDVPLKGDYARRDMARSARAMAVPFRLPPRFPFAGVAASRTFYWLGERSPDAARELAQALYGAAFAEGRDISSREAVAEVASEQGHDRDEVLAALDDPAVKDRLRAEVDAAIAAGVCGSPFILVDGEPFWGHDRLPEVERWLETGGW